MRKSKGTIWTMLGLLLIVAALCLSGYNLLEERRAEAASTRAAESLIKRITEKEAAATADPTFPPASDPGEEEIPDYLLSPYMEMPVEIVDGTDYIGVLDIPVLGLELPVISRWSYPDLKNAPCRYSGSAYLDSMILCAHNYPSHFGNLKTLQPGDSVTFTDVDGNEFFYEVVELETLMPTEMEELADGDWDLTLFTCTIGGRTRVVVRCQRTNPLATE